MGLLENRVAVITGAGRGIGRAIAETFVREGAKSPEIGRLGFYSDRPALRKTYLNEE